MNMLPTMLALSAALLPVPANSFDSTLPPETARLDSIVQGRGVQVYSCEQAPDGHFAWKLAGPEADLFNLATGKRVGHHSAGPTWQLDGGSTLRGVVLQSHPAVSANNVPWLLLRVAAQNPATTTEGMPQSTVTLVRRYNTQGGVAPATGCDAFHPAATVRVPYSANYAFYRETE